MWMRRITILPVAVVAVACGSTDPHADTLPRDRFIEVYTDLRAEEPSPEERDSILNHHGVSDEDLRSFVRRHANDPEVLADIWTEVEGRLRDGDGANGG